MEVSFQSIFTSNEKGITCYKHKHCTGLSLSPQCQRPPALAPETKGRYPHPSLIVHFVASMPTFMTDNILFSYVSMFSFLVRLFAVFLYNFQRMPGLDLIKSKKI